MVRPAHLMIVLLIGSAFALGYWLHAPEPSPATMPEIRPTKSKELVQAEQQLGDLREQVQQLQAQMKALREENSGLIDRLAAIGLKGEPKAVEPMKPSPTTEPPAEPDDYVGLAVELMNLRDLKEPPAPTVTVPIQQLEKLILGELQKQFPGDWGKREGEAFAALGLIPEAIDTLPPRAALLARLWGGWYDATQGALILPDKQADNGEPVLTDPVLGTALAMLQRGFAAAKPPSSPRTTDERLARQALIGGDAALVRLLHDMQKFRGPNPNELPADDPDHPLNQIPFPAFLRELELFPLTSGFHFAQALHSAAGFKQLSAAYGRPPESTSEVLDAGRYLDGQPLPLPEIALPTTSVDGAKPFWDDRLGQAATLAMLKRFNEEEKAHTAANGWVSDRLLAWHASGGDGRGNALWITNWQDAEASERGFDALREWVSEFYKLGIDKLGTDTPAQIRGRFVTLLKPTSNGRVVLIDAATLSFAQALIKLVR